jgi:hypothetical protein
LVSSEDDLLKRILAYNGTLAGLVTPQIAEWLLKLNTGNRPLVQRAIERFCKILKDKAWVNTGEPVIVSHEGVLNDGQHRLTAILTSGIAAELDVRFGTRRLHVKLRDAAMKRDRISQIDGAILAVKAWNAWARDEAIPPMRVLETERTNVGFPKVQTWREDRSPPDRH